TDPKRRARVRTARRRRDENKRLRQGAGRLFASAPAQAERRAPAALSQLHLRAQGRPEKFHGRHRKSAQTRSEQSRGKSAQGSTAHARGGPGSIYANRRPFAHANPASQTQPVIASGPLPSAPGAAREAANPRPWAAPFPPFVRAQ